MCSYSNTIDYGRRTWDVPPTYPHIYPQPGTYPVPTFPPPVITFTEPPPKRLPTQKEWDAFLKLLEAAETFDEEAGQPDCEDPEKVAWKQRIQDHLDALQAELDDEPGATDPATPEYQFSEVSVTTAQGTSSATIPWDVQQNIINSVASLSGDIDNNLLA